MTLTRADAERLVRILTLEQGGFRWNKCTCQDYCRNEFELRFSSGEIVVDHIPSETGGLARQAATLDQEAFSQWYDEHRERKYLTEAAAVEWLLVEAHRLDAADVEESLKSFESVDFEVPLTYRYDWDGVLRLAAVLQSGAVLEYPCNLWLPPKVRHVTLRMDWRVAEQDYHIVANEVPESLPAADAAMQDDAIAAPGREEQSETPCFEMTGDLDDFGRFLEKYYLRDTACTWLDFIRSHRTPATDRATEELRETCAIPLTLEDCQPLLHALRAGRVWLMSGDLATDDWATLGYEEESYLHRSSEHVDVTGIGGNPIYEGPQGNSEVWTEQTAIENMQSKILYRHRLLNILKAWV